MTSTDQSGIFARTLAISKSQFMRGDPVHFEETKPLVIQLLGQARSGKDFIAAQLKLYYESIGKSVEIMSYAAPMKQIAATLFGITLEQLDDFKNQPVNYPVAIMNRYSNIPIVNMDMRIFLQRMSNEAIKSIFGDAVWANLVQSAISKSSADIIIIPDCRFTVELEALGGTTIRIINSALPAPMQHASELELTDFVTDFVLDNTNYQATSAVIAELANRVYPIA